MKKLLPEQVGAIIPGEPGTVEVRSITYRTVDVSLSKAYNPEEKLKAKQIFSILYQNIPSADLQGSARKW